MRESLWLYLRGSSVGRWMRSHPAMAPLARRLSFWLLPASHNGVARVRSGPLAGLRVEVHSRWNPEIWDGTAELPVQRLIGDLAGRHTVLYDVGGGIGLYSLLAARQGARVFSFEPHPRNAECILRNARRNGLENAISVFPQAVHSRAGAISMVLTDAHRGGPMALLSAGRPSDRDALQVECITLDEFARSHPAPTLIKVDVEGNESEVLKGAAELFGRGGPQLLCEVHDAANEAFVTRWLSERGYRWRWIEPPTKGPRHLFAEPERDPEPATPPEAS